MHVPNKQLMWLSAMMMVATSVGRADDSDRQRIRTEREAREERIWKTEERIRETEPRRRDTPVREKNISDDEIREIENVIHDIFPHALVNISTVVTGCPCEEGPKCKDQVWLTALKGDDAYELQLSHINNRWVVGPIQQWWLDYKKLQSQSRRQMWRGSFYPFGRDCEELVERFPVCEKNSQKFPVKP